MKKLTVYYGMGSVTLTMSEEGDGTEDYVDLDDELDVPLDDACGRELEGQPCKQNIRFYDALNSPDLERLDALNREAEGLLSPELELERFQAWVRALNQLMREYGVKLFEDTEGEAGVETVDAWRQRHIKSLE